MSWLFSAKRWLASFNNKTDKSLTFKIKPFWFKYILVINSLISKLNVVLDNKRIEVHEAMTAENIRDNLKILWKVFSNLKIKNNRIYVN